MSVLDKIPVIDFDALERETFTFGVRLALGLVAGCAKLFPSRGHLADALVTCGEVEERAGARLEALALREQAARLAKTAIQKERPALPEEPFGLGALSLLGARGCARRNRSNDRE